MSRLLRASDRTPGEIETFLAETYPGADARTRLHALICWSYHAPLFEGRGGRQAVAGRAAARGVTPAKLRQIVAGDLAGITWPALDAVLAACGAPRAETEVAQRLFNEVQAVDPGTIPPVKAAAWTDPLDDWAPVQFPRRSEQVWAWPGEQEPDTPAEPSPCTAPPVRCGPDVPGCVAAAGGAGPDESLADEARPVDDEAAGTAGHADASVDPWTAGDPEAFVALMRKFRLLKGERPYRVMASVCARHPAVERPYAYASFWAIGKSGKLPRRDLVCAYIAGAGGTDAEIDEWLKARARLAIQPPGGLSANGT
ncbi:hypothetical protein GWI34_16295 [Actinomadura sp. DSM 109109]|nr:hypothetical protein [Actinomadura lepetitiana]